MDFEALSNSIIFVVSAYIAAFLPWTAIASTDFISSKWVSVRRTRAAGYRNLLWTVFPMSYLFFYGIVQGEAGDYTEMSAAFVAALFAALFGVRTMWGLLQLHLFHAWSCRSIDALKAVGIHYHLRRLQQREPRGRRPIAEMTTAEIAGEILVNEKIIDNQILHGDVQCFLQFGDTKLFQGGDSDPLPTRSSVALQTMQDIFVPMLDPVCMYARLLLLPAAMAAHFALVLAGRRKPTKLQMVPKEPVEVWVHWAATFTAQGLQKWMEHFDVAVDPRTNGDMRRKRAVERFHERGKYFGSQLLASAALQLWTEHGSGKGVSPMLWDVWNEDSDMSDGRFVKQELFNDAVTKGTCLPFEASQKTALDLTDPGTNGGFYSYDAYKDLLAEFLAELPVRSCFVKEMRKFDVNRLEWFTILLHMGNVAIEMGAKSFKQHCTSGAHDTESESRTHSSTAETESSSSHGAEAGGLGRGKELEATRILLSQIGATRYTSMMRGNVKDPRDLHEVTSVLMNGIPLLRNALTAVSDHNRLVSKAGQLVDVWLSLVCGDQISFLVEELNDRWKKICFGTIETSRYDCETHKNWDLREAHKQLEKRRLARRIANKNGRRYEYLDQYATFMGYRMESVRTFLGRWVESNANETADDLLEAAKTRALRGMGLHLQLSSSIGWALKNSNALQTLSRKGMQCRLIWEIQNKLEAMLLSQPEAIREEEMERVGLTAMMLLVLSFPGLRVELIRAGNHSVVQNNQDCCVINTDCLGGGGPDSGLQRHSRAGRDARNNIPQVPTKIAIHVACGPQDVSLEADLYSSGMCTLALHLQDFAEGLKWKWWRDSFLGRLEGFHEWQRDMGISPNTLNSRIIENREVKFPEMETIVNSRLRIWAEWPPFRPQFCRFELEGSNFLKQSITIGEMRVNDNIIGSGLKPLPIQSVSPVSYAAAHEHVLRDSCRLVHGSMENHPTNFDGVEDFLLLMRHQIDALHFGEAESLKECMKMLCDRGNMESDVSEGIQVLSSFVGTMFSVSSRTLENGKEAEVEEVILPECEKLIRRFAGSKHQVESLLKVMNTCSLIDPVKHCQAVMRLMQQMLTFNTDIGSELFMMLNCGVDLLYVEGRKIIRIDGNNCPCEKDSSRPGGYQRWFIQENHRVSAGVLKMVEHPDWNEEVESVRVSNSYQSGGINLGMPRMIEKTIALRHLVIVLRDGACCGS